MNASDKAAVNAAKNGTAKNGAAKSTSTINAETGKALISEKTALARRKFADSIKAQIIGGGFSDVLSEIAAGDYGDIGTDILVSFDIFIDGFEQDVVAIQAAETPKFLPASYQTTCVES